MFFDLSIFSGILVTNIKTHTFELQRHVSIRVAPRVILQLETDTLLNRTGLRSGSQRVAYIRLIFRVKKERSFKIPVSSSYKDKKIK